MKTTDDPRCFKLVVMAGPQEEVDASTAHTPADKQANCLFSAGLMDELTAENIATELETAKHAFRRAIVQWRSG